MKRGGGRAAWVAACAVLALLAPPAAVSAPTVELTDARGVTVRLAGPPARIVSLLPSLTETVCALDACDRLVGVDRYSNWPASVRALPQVGGGIDPNVEAIAALQPDLVLAAQSSRASERLESLGLKVAVLEPKSYDEVHQALRALAAVLGRRDAEPVWQALQAQVDAVARELPAHARGLAVYVEVSNAPYAAGAASFIGQTLARLGQRNVVPPALGPFPKLNPEFVVRADPQLIMVSARGGQGLEQRPGWGRIRAVQAGRVCRFDEAQMDVLVRPGPRMGEAARLMAGCLSGSR